MLRFPSAEEQIKRFETAASNVGERPACHVVRENAGGGGGHSEGKQRAQAEHRDDADVYQQSYEGGGGGNVRNRCINRGS